MPNGMETSEKGMTGFHGKAQQAIGCTAVSCVVNSSVIQTKDLIVSRMTMV